MGSVGKGYGWVLLRVGWSGVGQVRVDFLTGWDLTLG